MLVDRADFVMTTLKYYHMLHTEEYTGEVSGTLRCNRLSASLSAHDHALCNNLNEACKQSKIPIMSWPHPSTEATSKYDKHSNLLSKAFPWLCLKGVGDYGQYSREEKLSVSEGARQLVL
jgi:hypothetical protein